MRTAFTSEHMAMAYWIVLFLMLAVIAGALGLSAAASSSSTIWSIVLLGVLTTILVIVVGYFWKRDDGASIIVPDLGDRHGRLPGRQ